MAGPGMRALVLRAVEDPGRTSRVAARMTAAIAAELPALEADEPLREALAASTESVLVQLVEMVRGDLPPAEARLPSAAEALVGELARRGAPLELLLRAYHVGHAAFFDIWAHWLREEGLDGDELADAVEAGAAWTFTYVTALSAGVVGAYGQERDRWVRSAAAMRSDEVTTLLAGEPVDLAQTSARLRYPLDRHHLALVLWPAGPDVPGGALERAAAELAGVLGAQAVLHVPLGGGALATWAGSAVALAEPTRGALALPEAVARSAIAALGAPGHGLDGFRASHRQALHARRAAELGGTRPGALVRYRDVALTALLAADLEHARAFAREQLGPLAADSDEAARLAATLRAYLEERASPRRTAGRLGIHENTVKQRIRQVQELIGPLDGRTAELLVALRLRRLIDAEQDR